MPALLISHHPVFAVIFQTREDNAGAAKPDKVLIGKPPALLTPRPRHLNTPRYHPEMGSTRRYTWAAFVSIFAVHSRCASQQRRLCGAFFRQRDAPLVALGHRHCSANLFLGISVFGLRRAPDFGGWFLAPPWRWLASGDNRFPDLFGHVAVAWLRRYRGV